MRFSANWTSGACHWVGQSLGTFVGMRLAARRPGLIRSLVLLSPRIRRNPLAFRMRVEGLFAALRVSELVPAVNHALRYRLADYLMNEVYGSSFMSDQSRAADRQRLRDHHKARLVPAEIPAARGSIRYPVNEPGMLATITVPTLVLVGEDDYTSGSGVRHAEEVAAAIPGSRLVTIPGAGHVLVVEQALAVRDAVTGFLREVESR